LVGKTATTVKSNGSVIVSQACAILMISAGDLKPRNYAVYH